MLIILILMHIYHLFPWGTNALNMEVLPVDRLNISLREMSTTSCSILSGVSECDSERGQEEKWWRVDACVSKTGSDIKIKQKNPLKINQSLIAYVKSNAITRWSLFLLLFSVKEVTRSERN